MNLITKNSVASRRKASSVGVALALVSVTALIVSACRPGDAGGPQVAGWTLVDPSQRHPIMVSQEPSKMSVRVSRGSAGLSPHQKSQLIGFLDKYRASDAGNSKLVIATPSGSANEIAAMQAVAEMRHLMREAGFDESSISIEAYHEAGDPQPPIRVSYLRYVAQGPDCGQWPTNLAVDRTNVPYPNFGCATQRNFAAQIANPADLLGPRNMTPRASERRDVMNQKYIKGESTISRKQQEEKSQVKGSE